MTSNLDILLRGAENVIGAKELGEKLANGKKLKIKFGVDPTRPDLTFGHMVVFNKLKQFQDLGHEAILLIGDYTTMIGDPSGRSATRPMLSREQIAENSKTYLDQAFKILDKSKTTIARNSDWFSKMSFEDMIILSTKMTVAQMLERDDFSKRYANKTPISIVEFLYPLLQGHDSVMLKSDVELGGSDQLFNLMVGRALQKSAGQDEQCVITMPLLVGLDGERKMSKSYDNYIAFNDSSKDVFGKIMSISDETMWKYYKFLLLRSDEEIEQLKLNHPMQIKKNLALELTAKFHDSAVAQHELEEFESVFSKNQLPTDMPVFSLSKFSQDRKLTLIDALFLTNLLPSKKELRRLFDQGAVKLNNEKKSHEDICDLDKTGTLVVQVGKRLFVKFTK